jgi:hypothetical protein
MVPFDRYASPGLANTVSGSLKRYLALITMIHGADVDNL